MGQHLSRCPCRTVVDDLDGQPDLAGPGSMGQIAPRSSADDAFDVFMVLFESDHDEPQMRTRTPKCGQQFEDVVGARRVDKDQRDPRGVERPWYREQHDLDRSGLYSILGKDCLQPKYP